MGTDNEFGPDTETIRAWLAKRATYAKDARVIGAPRGSAIGSTTLDTPAAPAAPDASPVAIPEPELEPDPPATPRLSETGRQVDSVGAGRSVVEALGDLAPTAAAGESDNSDPDPTPIPRRDTPDSTTAGRSVVEALTDDRPRATSVRRGAARISEAPRGSYLPTETPPPAPAAVAGVPQVKRNRWIEPEEHRESLQASTDVDFPVRSGMRRALSLILVAALAATAVTGWVAYQERTVLAGVVAGVMGFVTLVVWAVRASVTTVQLSIKRGQLRIVRGGRTEVVELASPYTPVAIIGEPGQRQWTVLAERPGLPLIVINSSMVDPYWFTTALYRLRPELRPGAAQPSDEYAGR